MSLSQERTVAPRTARFLRELEGPREGCDHAADVAWRTDPDERPQLRAFPELVAAVALVGVLIIVLAAWQVGSLISG